VDDVVNVSGHRLSTSEIEAALIEHHAVAESAVVGVQDELTGQAVNAFVSLREDSAESVDQIRKDLILQVRKSIGPFAAPKAVYVVPDLPKTRSGKIMRRILRKILAGEEDQLGDVSTVSLWPAPERYCCIIRSDNVLTDLRLYSCLTRALSPRSSRLFTTVERSEEVGRFWESRLSRLASWRDRGVAYLRLYHHNEMRCHLGRIFPAGYYQGRIQN